MSEIVEAADQELIAKAIEFFGLTRDPNEAGYLLPDGAMLDLSGRHSDPERFGRKGDYWIKTKKDDPYRGRRFCDHRRLPDGIVSRNGTEGMWEFCIRTGAIRCFSGVGYDLYAKPTAKQISAMCTMSRAERDVIVEVTKIKDGIEHKIAHQRFDRLRLEPLVEFLRTVFPDI